MRSADWSIWIFPRAPLLASAASAGRPGRDAGCLAAHCTALTSCAPNLVGQRLRYWGGVEQRRGVDALAAPSLAIIFHRLHVVSEHIYTKRSSLPKKKNTTRSFRRQCYLVFRIHKYEGVSYRVETSSIDQKAFFFLSLNNVTMLWMRTYIQESNKT